VIPDDFDGPTFWVIHAVDDPPDVAGHMFCAAPISPDRTKSGVMRVTLRPETTADEIVEIAERFTRQWQESLA
jgi:hypothetical protein